MINCPFCGKELTPPNAKFCSSCGSQITRATEKQASTTLPTQKMRYTSPKPSYRPLLIVVLGFATIGIIIIAFVFVSWFVLSSLFGPSLGSGIEIHSDEDFSKYSSSGTGTVDDPYILSNYSLTEQFYGFSIHNTKKHFMITQCTIEICYEGINIEDIAAGTATIFNNNITYDDCWVWETGPHAGITIVSSPEVNISNNIISQAGYEGIVIENSKQCYLSNNTVSGLSQGITLDNSDSSIIKDNYLIQNYEAIQCFDSDYLNIANNTCINNQAGIVIVGSDFAHISNNVCTNTTTLWSSWATSGIILDTCYNCTIANNTVIQYSQGIYVPGSSYCQIFNNSINNNVGYGVSIGSAYDIAEFNAIFHNSFIDNNVNGLSQASDNGTSNYWYNVTLAQGNYWSNWNQTGFYPIAGTANASDMYPLAEPPV